MRLSFSLSIFKHTLFGSDLYFSDCNPLFYYGNRLRINNSTLNYDLFNVKNCIASPACNQCGADIEDVKHYVLYCPMFAALRNVLLTCAAHLLGIKWCLASDKKKIKWFLYGVSDADFHTNVNLFEYVQ